MNIQNNYSPNFKANIAPNVLHQLKRQEKFYGGHLRTTSKLTEQIQKVEKWGIMNSEIIICKNTIGNYALGLKVKISPKLELTWPFERVNGNMELSQFLNLREENIINTEKRISGLYKKYGLKIFDRVK